MKLLSPAVFRNATADSTPGTGTFREILGISWRLGLRRLDRWPGLGTRVCTRTSVRCMLQYELFL